MKQPRLNVHELLGKPAARRLLQYLASSEDPVRFKQAREATMLSMGQFGLAIRALERHGLAVRRAQSVEGPDGRTTHHQFVEVTDIGRDHAERLPEPAPATMAPPASGDAATF